MFSIAISLAFYGLSACSADSEFESFLVVNDESREFEDFRRSEVEAVEIASNMLYSNLSRAASMPLKIEYGISNTSILSRSESAKNDTILYIVTPEDNEGFVLVSVDKRMPEVLAFSKSGSFNLSEDPNYVFRASFYDNLDKYKDYRINNNWGNGYSFTKYDGLFDEMIELCPSSKWHWSQYTSPYVDSVRIDHPYAPVGCVGLATGIVMAYCRDTVTVSGQKFLMMSIRYGMIHGTPMVTFNRDVPFVPMDSLIISGPQYRMYSREEAHRWIAKLLALIGKEDNLSLVYNDVKNNSYTSGYNYKAYNFLKNLGYDVVSPKWNMPFNEALMIEHLLNDEILFMDSRTYNNLDNSAIWSKQHSGHAWVIDGCCFDYNPEDASNSRKNVFFHCNWGGDGNNGYYYGGVFWIAEHWKYMTHNYFAVRRTNDLKSN